jgi:hypothetical protein
MATLAEILETGYSWIGNDGVRRFPVREMYRNEKLSLEMSLSPPEILEMIKSGRILLSRREWAWVPGPYYVSTGPQAGWGKVPAKKWVEEKV